MKDKETAILNLYQSKTVKNGLTAKGYLSSVHIYHDSERKFAKRVRDILPEKEAKEIYRHAGKRYMLLTHMATAYATASRRNIPNVEGQFENIPDYQEIFGNQDYCACPKCKSIFGPAAYFVDLMRIIEKYIVLDDSPTALSKPVPLKKRREDLWDMVLSCENTNKEITYLNLVNNILEKYSGQGDDIYAKLSKSYYPHVVPFCLPLEKARIWLGRRNLSLEVFLGQWGMETESVVRESLKLSPELFTMLENPLTPDNTKKLLGITQCNLEELSKPSVFMEKLQIDRKELYMLLEQDIGEKEEGRDALLHSLFINRGMGNGGYISLKDEKLVGLDMDNLERIVRFVRVAKIMQVTFCQLECIMRTAGYREDGAFSLNCLWKLSQTAIWLQEDCVSAMSFFSRMKDYGESDEYNGNLYKNIFSRTREEMSRIGNPAERFRVLSGALRTEVGNLYFLRDYFGTDETVEEDVYYRHIQAARLFGLSVEDYTRALSIFFADKLYTFTPEKLEEFALFVREKNLDLSVWFQLMDLQGDGKDSFIDFKRFHERIEYLRNNLSEKEQESREAKDSYVYTQLADYFHSDTETMRQLFFCVLPEKEREQWPEKLLTDDTYPEIDSTVKAMSGYLL